MVTYVSKMFATDAEAEEYLSTYRIPVEEAGGEVSVVLWERKDTDATTLTKETEVQGEIVAEVAKAVEVTVKRGPVLYMILPEDLSPASLLAGSEELAFKPLS
ncbi:MAG TPA: hypothetical protein VGD98_06010 [Ktedonobacteraceae bacterium]